ncbi:hypothetical protein HHI36_010986 [Cryptolaemus montrouzieri]|uniref:Zinc finger PHD-type domain-containing protein n=1 Tax=Cryptolaemus montrouzieri TaxID=559131 RepID=A0ABD2MKH3_9CUCU
MSISMDVFCSKCDDFMCDEDTYLCDCCGDPFHKKCMNLPSNKMNVMQLKMQRVFLFCNDCLLSFNRVQRLLKCFEFDESNLQELKSPNSMLKKQYFDLKTKLEALETRLSTTAQPDERTNATKLPNPFENEEIISEMSNIDFEPNEVRVNNCRKIKLEKDIIVQEGKVDIVSNEKRQTYIEMQKGSVVPEVKMDFVSSEEHQTHIESAYLSSSSSTKKASTPKPKKTVSPKVLSPKIASPKVEPPPSKPLSPKIGSPRVNLTKLDISEEGKNLKSSKTINAATTKGTNTTADSGSEGKAQKASTLKVKIGAKAKTEKKVAPSAKQVTASSEEDTPMPAKKVTPRKPVKLAQNTGSSSDSVNKPCQPCSIRCQGVQGLVPTLQCRLCLCLYHNECVGMVPNINIPNYVCKNCQLEQGGQNMLTGIAPPPLTPITALQSVTNQPTALPKLQRIPKSPETEIAQIPVVKSENIENVPTTTCNTTNENTSILGHVTSWLPQNSRIQVDSQPRNIGEIAEPSRPQYVEFLAGRKFLIIPKYNVVSVSPTVTAVRSVEATNHVQETIDLIPGQTADVATTVKTEPISPSKPENSQTPLSAEPMEVEDNDIKPTVLSTDQSSNDAPVTSESSIKPAPTPKKRTLKLNNITNTSSEKSNESHFMENYLQNLSYGYNTLLYVFQYLKVQDLLRAGCVCTMWKDIASHPLLWRTVRMKNSQVHSFEGLANTLQKHGTVQLDLRKMLLTNCDEVWPEFSNNIGKVDTLRKIELCRCPAFVVERLTETNPKLEVVNAVTIRCEKMNLAGLANWTNLRELRLKSTTGLTLESDIESLRSLVSLKSLSLTSIKDLNNMKLDVISDLSNLESLDLGECTDFPKNFGKDILSKLKKLEKLRLEKGQGSCHTFEMLDAVKDMHQLEQLELVNFDIKAGFDKALGACKNIKKLLIIPTYISQSATTNHMVLGGVLRLQKSLSHFVWGVTLELLRVTELFVDQCEEPEKKEKKEKKVIGNGDSIPVLKPVPLITDDKSEIPPALDPPQVEILALPGLQKLLLQSLPTTRVKILKIPFHATWRQSITDAVN